MPYPYPPSPPTALVMGSYLSEGYQSGRGPMSPGLEAQGERWTELSKASALTPHSVLNQLHPSNVAANLSAPSQQGRLLANGLMLSNTSNGASSDTADTDNYLNMMGRSE